MRFVWKHLPLPSLHPDAPAAHIASVAAHKQGKFWGFHDKLFANQRNLKYDAFVKYAGELSMDVARFEGDFKLLQNRPGSPLQLFDLSEDPYESNDCIANRDEHHTMTTILRTEIQKAGVVPWQKLDGSV